MRCGAAGILCSQSGSPRTRVCSRGSARLSVHACICTLGNSPASTNTCASTSGGASLVCALGLCTCACARGSALGRVASGGWASLFRSLQCPCRAGAAWLSGVLEEHCPQLRGKQKWIQSCLRRSWRSYERVLKDNFYP